MTGRLAGKIALITGAGSGMGAAAAKLFASEGAHVAVNDITDLGEATAGSIKAAGGTAIFVRADVTQAADVERMVTTVVAAFGGLDVLYNNAGIGPPDDAARLLKISVGTLKTWYRHGLITGKAYDDKGSVLYQPPTGPLPRRGAHKFHPRQPSENRP
jgi:NAD(P)-dependent dehydrogenase (short-subunit alcohol dehydrogenase family)